MRKRITGVLAAVAILSVVAAGIGKANAYFTTYARALGGQTINLGDETEIHEDYSEFKKTVSISNSADSNQAVYVRATAFGGSQYELVEGDETDKKNWGTRAADGYWYYAVPLERGETTGKLVISITDPTSDDPDKKPKAEDGKNFNIVVVYETVPAVQDGDGKYEAADWEMSEANGWKQSKSTVNS